MLPTISMEEAQATLPEIIGKLGLGEEVVITKVDQPVATLRSIALYSRSFRADRASIILAELGLENHHLRDHLTQRRTFFDNKERLQKLKTLVASNDTAVDLDRKMLPW